MVLGIYKCCIQRKSLLIGPCATVAQLQIRARGWDEPLRSPSHKTAAVHYAMTSPALTARLHAAGKRVFAWTVNSPHMMQRALDAGVDAIVTNHPVQVREVFLKRRAPCIRLYGRAPALI